MPCYDGRDSAKYREQERKEFIKNYGYDTTDKDHNSPTAKFLCGAMWQHHQDGTLDCLTKETLEWWEEHKLRDIQKLKFEIRGLTPNGFTRQFSGLTDYEKYLYPMAVKA